jgi:hypothetical protein
MAMRDMDCNEEANGNTRDELVQRIALMEAMIAEGRQSTGRAGWIFVMWGMLYFVATGWVYYLPLQNWAWPVCMTAGGFAVGLWGRRQRRGGMVAGARSRTLGAVWSMMGMAVALFAVFGGVTHKAWHAPEVYMAAILFFIGLAHAISAVVLRWVAQGMAAAVWWGGGIAMLFVSSQAMILEIFLGATFFGQIVFGLYAMVLERRMTQERRHG